MRKNIAFILTFSSAFLLPSAILIARVPLQEESAGVLQGRVILKTRGTPLHNAEVIIVQIGRSTESDENGNFEFQQVPSGSFDVVASLPGLSSELQTVEMQGSAIETVNFELAVDVPRVEVTVTASGRQQTAFQTFQSVVSLDSLDLAQKDVTSIGEVLDKEPGVAKRSFGPGSARPVIRGFDGDRVLIMQDGISTGALSSQSGDHGEPINTLTLERLEVVKGPATLLYGSSAIGGAVNAVTGHQLSLEHPHEGIRGYATGLGGSNNAQGGGSGGFEYGTGKWLLWADGGTQRTDDYRTAVAKVENSETRVSNGSGGAGWVGDKIFLGLGYRYDSSRYGIPFDEDDHGEETAHGHEGPIDLTLRRNNIRFDGGLLDLGSGLESFRLSLNYSDYQHKELEGTEVGTVFDNQQLNARGVFQQLTSGFVSGSFGFSFFTRNYEAIGEEALSPPVDQNNFALFALEELNFKRFKLQFGGRLEHNRYNPVGLVDRSFTEVSGAAGVYVPLWKNGAFVVNYTNSSRTPALEELYNKGPHHGNKAFEIGNPYLRRERSNGLDFSIRHEASQIQAEANFFYYDISDFVFLAPTGNITEELTEAKYLQEDSRYLGTEIHADMKVHPNVWLNLGMDTVEAELKGTQMPLPRIPPLRGRIGLTVNYKGLSVQPELIVTNSQEEVFSTETRTPGHGVVNLMASYTLPQKHFVHIFTVNASNIGNRFYQNHLSFIKDVAPELGRGVRVTYALRFF